MKQPIKQNIKKLLYIKNKDKYVNDKLDGSGLETYFKKNVLDKLKLNYIQQFEAKSIGRFYDFLLTDYKVIIECDGQYWHCDPRIYEKPINKIQIKNKRIDEAKNEWAILNGYTILRFWEYDIKNHTSKVIKTLKNILNK